MSFHFKPQRSHRLLALLLAVLFAASALLPLSAATIEKPRKSYAINVVFDNSGSMYLNQSWCRAKYSIEIFAAMLDFAAGDVLKVFPMWAVTTSGSKTDDGSFSPLEIRSIADIDKVHNMYTPNAGGTPFAPVTEAYQDLQTASATEKWLIVLTDGAFEREKRDDKGGRELNLSEKLLPLASDQIKVQYLGVGADAKKLRADKTTNFYANNVSGEELKSTLVSICNRIFQRVELPAEYLRGSELTLNLSVTKLLVFVQGSDSSVGSLTTVGGQKVPVMADSGRRSYSTVSAQGGAIRKTPPIDTSLTGQIVTFGACEKGVYALEYAAEQVQVFYEPDTDILLTLTAEDGTVIPEGQHEIYPGDYTLNYTLVDRVTREDILHSDLLGNVTLGADIDGVEIPDGGTATMPPNETIYIRVQGTYLDEYRITTDDYKENYTYKVVLPPEDEFAVTLRTEQENNWFQTSKHESWQPYRATITKNGQPLTESEFSETVFRSEVSPEADYYTVADPENSSYLIYVGHKDADTYAEPAKGRYHLTVTADWSDPFGRILSASASIGFRISSWPLWLVRFFWLLLALLVTLVIAAILFLVPAYPKRMRFATQSGKSGAAVNIKNHSINFRPSGKATPALTLKTEKKTKLWRKYSKLAKIGITGVSPNYAVQEFKLGSQIYTRQGQGFVNAQGESVNLGSLHTVLGNNSEISFTCKSNDIQQTTEGTLRINRK